MLAQRLDVAFHFEFHRARKIGTRGDPFAPLRSRGLVRVAHSLSHDPPGVSSAKRSQPWVTGTFVTTFEPRERSATCLRALHWRRVARESE